MVPPAGLRSPPSSMLTEADADFPSDVAVIVALPAAIAVTNPFSTETIDGADDVQVIVRSSVSPASSLAMAVSRALSPGTRSSAPEDSVTLLTGSGATTSLQLTNTASAP